MENVMNILLGIGTLALQLFALFLVVGFFLRASRIHEFFRVNALLIGFVLSLLAGLGTLYYSEVAGFIPCTLCWYQRILLYPQILFFGYGLIKKDPRALLYSTFFSGAGLLLALYHITLPLWTNPLFCDPATALCLEKYVTIFGYISIPVMSASVFAVLFLLSIHGYTYKRQSSQILLNQ